MTIRQPQDSVVTGQTTFQTLPNAFVNVLTPGIAAPSVLNATIHKAGGSVVTITNFKNGQKGQHISVLGDGVTTIQNGTSIKTNTGANKLLATGVVYRFTLFDNTWYEDA